MLVEYPLESFAKLFTVFAGNTGELRALDAQSHISSSTLFVPKVGSIAVYRIVIEIYEEYVEGRSSHFFSLAITAPAIT